MRILGARSFLSFLAGKLSRFIQLLLAELLSILAEKFKFKFVIFLRKIYLVEYLLRKPLKK